MTFRDELSEVLKLFQEIQELETQANLKVVYAQGKFREFIKKHGMGEKFTLPELVALGLKNATGS